MEKDIKVLIADDHRLVVDMIEIILASQGNFRVETAGSFGSALDMVTASSDFNVIMLDLDMPGMNGLAGFERMIEASAETPVVLFSGNARLDAVQKAMRMGVRGYIPKTLAPQSLISALRFVAAGEIYYPAEMLRNMIQPRKDQTPSRLTARELDVIRELVAGATNKQIATRIGIPETTVKMCVRSVCHKLNVSNRTQVALTALSKGLV